MYSKNVVEDYVDAAVKQAIQIHLTSGIGSLVLLVVWTITKVRGKGIYSSLFISNKNSKNKNERKK